MFKLETAGTNRWTRKAVNLPARNQWLTAQISPSSEWWIWTSLHPPPPQGFWKEDVELHVKKHSAMSARNQQRIRRWHVWSWAETAQKKPSRECEYVSVPRITGRCNGGATVCLRTVSVCVSDLYYLRWASLRMLISIKRKSSRSGWSFACCRTPEALLIPLKARRDGIESDMVRVATHVSTVRIDAGTTECDSLSPSNPFQIRLESKVRGNRTLKHSPTW